MEAHFVTPADGQFASKYQRNNKKGGLKNLRCFPTCTNKDHRKGSPCTGPVVVEINGKLSSKSAEIVAFARFRSDNTDEDEDIIPFVLGNQYDKDQIEKYVRTKKNPLGAEFRGKVKMERNNEKPKVISATVAFNERGWHYGWTGGRYKVGQLHYMEVNFFESNRSAPQSLVHIGLVESTRFSIQSSRRANPEDKLKRRVKTKLEEFTEDSASNEKASKKHRKGGNGDKRNRKVGTLAGLGDSKDDFILPGNTETVDELLDQLIQLEDSNIPIGPYVEDDDYALDDSGIRSDEDIDDIDLQFYFREYASPCSVLDEEKDSILISVGKRVVANETGKTGGKPLPATSDDSAASTATTGSFSFPSQDLEKSSASLEALLPEAPSTDPGTKRVPVNQSGLSDQQDGQDVSKTNAAFAPSEPGHPETEVQIPVQQSKTNASLPQPQQQPKKKIVGSGLQHLQNQVPFTHVPPPSSTRTTPPTQRPKVSMLTRLFRALTCS